MSLPFGIPRNDAEEIGNAIAMASLTPVTDEDRRRARARVTAATIFRRVSAGTLGINLVQAVQATAGAVFEDVPGGYVMHCHGVSSAVCRTRAGAVILWARTSELAHHS